MTKHDIGQDRVLPLVAIQPASPKLQWLGCVFRRTVSAMPTTNETLDEILNLAAAHLRLPRETVTADDDFFKTLRIDSLQALDMLTRLEQHFQVELPDYELQNVTDFRSLANKIQMRL